MHKYLQTHHSLKIIKKGSLWMLLMQKSEVLGLKQFQDGSKAFKLSVLVHFLLVLGNFLGGRTA